MAKTRFSVSIELHTYIILRELAKTHFFGNTSSCLEWVIRSAMKPDRLADFMAKHHCREMNAWLETKEKMLLNPDRTLKNP